MTPVHSASPQEAASALERVLAPDAFRNAGRLRRLLRFLVEETLRDPDTPLKEHWLAVQVFDRPEPFDPRVDSVVRIAVRQLRFKLRDDYDTEGKGERLRIEIPKGSYLQPFVIRRRAGCSGS